MSTFNKANILIPKSIDFKKWSVVACDQYTSEPEYWERVEKTVGDKPSCVKIIFPEVYLEKDNSEKRIESINRTMKKYIDDGLFEEYKASLVYVERTVNNGKIRKGLVGTIDLEDYDFSKGSATMVRATEGTVIERIPPRVKIRENAPLELPHIMILIDDEKKSIIEPLAEMKDSFKKVYDFDLMEKGGHIEGRIIDGDKADKVIKSFEGLNKQFDEKYKKDGFSRLIFAMGDGNHSLATAKTCWENIKKNLTDKEKENHPARFALCEIVNLHDESLEFEPIHRVLFDVDKDNFIKEIEKYYTVSYTDNGGQGFEIISSEWEKRIYIQNPSSNLAVGTLQSFIDDYISRFGGRVDYIHGEAVTKKLGGQEGNLGFILPVMDKSELFPTVMRDGALPRKTFSMGEANEKRFYMEAKLI